MRAAQHDADAEAAVIGSCLGDAVALAQARELVDSDDFFDARWQVTFSAMLALDAAGHPVDAISVRDQLRRTGGEWSEAALQDLDGVREHVVGTDAVAHHTGILVELARKRRLAVTGAEITSAARDPAVTSSEVLELAESSLSASQRNSQSTGPMEIADVLDVVVERVGAAVRSGVDHRGLHTGFVDLDVLLGGIEPGSLVVVGARPSMGKTAFGTGVALACARSGTPTLFVSAEMSSSELGLRILAGDAKVPSSELRTGKVSETALGRVEAARERRRTMPLRIDDRSSPSISQIAGAARAMRTRRGLGLVVVDYLQLVRGVRDAERRDLEIAEVSRGLKALARDHECVVIALAQLNREAERREDKRPLLSDLRESGQIEADADVVLLLYRDSYYNADTKFPGIAEVIVAKNRSGPTGSIRLAWLATTTRFGNLDRVRTIQDAFPGALVLDEVIP